MDKNMEEILAIKAKLRAEALPIIRGYIHGLASDTFDPHINEAGLCDNLTWVLNHTYEEPFRSMRNQYQWEYEVDEIVFDCLEAPTLDWGHYSGDLNFPIPDPDDVEYPRSSYLRARNQRTMWDTATAYGRLRWAYCKYLNAYFQEGLTCQSSK